MWAHFRAVFSAAGVTNALWAMDYSRGIGRQTKFDQFAAALWPGDSSVDWLFFNAFGDHPMSDPQGRGNWSALVGGIYHKFERAATAGHNFTGVPWGVGAFQPKPPPQMDLKDRKKFLKQAEKALSISQFPRLRGMVYYDTAASDMPASFQPAYEHYLSSQFFTVNDAPQSRNDNVTHRHT